MGLDLMQEVLHVLYMSSLSLLQASLTVIFSFYFFSGNTLPGAKMALSIISTPPLLGTIHSSVWMPHSAQAQRDPTISLGF